MVHVEKCVSNLSRILLPHHPVLSPEASNIWRSWVSFPLYFMHTHEEIRIRPLLFSHESSYTHCSTLKGFHLAYSGVLLVSLSLFFFFFNIGPTLLHPPHSHWEANPRLNL